MFGPETSRDKEQNTLSLVAFAIGNLRKNIICNYPSVHKFQQPVLSAAQKYQQGD